MEVLRFLCLRGNIELRITYVGYVNEAVPVSSAQTDVSVILHQESNTISDVVVTALGIQKQKKSLGYSIQEVKGQALVESREVNLVNDLTGKVAGLQVVRGGNGPGGSSQIFITWKQLFNRLISTIDCC